MTNWQNLHLDFQNPQLIKKWANKGFAYQQVELWIKLLGKDFNPQDYDLFDHLREKLKKG